MDQQDNSLIDTSFDGTIRGRDIIREMQDSYLDYAMSVIISRALPDVRDGLKPVQRRILYTMHTMGLSAGSKYKKSARIVGDVMGKYHPHGDSAIYTAMVRLAQDFSMRNMLVDGQGNFGSVDGDNAAAARYTEARLTRYSDAMLEDIEKETVVFRPNYDGSEQEPVVLPGKFPNLLVNGNMGIAVGMATNIPPHNLCEVIDAIMVVLKNPDATLDDIMEHIKGPDFPTAGVIYDSEHIKQVYASGRGSIIMRAKAVIDEGKSGKPRIVVTEIPYQVNKSSMIERMALLVRDKKIVGITDIRDESNKEGIRVVIELRRDVQPKKILNQLYKMTQMQASFGVNMIALADGVQPQVMGIKTVLEHYIAHRKIVIYKRTQFELQKAEDRLHILEGLKIAIDNIDEVIRTIRAAQTQDQAKTDLIAKFALSDRQAEAILSMQLRRLAALERKKIEEEIAELEALVHKLKAILADGNLIIEIIANEITELKEKYGDARRTEVIPSKLGEFKITDTIANDDVVVALTRENYIKRMPVATFKAQRRGGKGVVGMTTKEEDEMISLLATKNHNQLLFFTNTGRVFKLHVYEIDEASRQAKGAAIVNLLNLQPGEKVVSVLDSTAEKEAKYLFMTTKRGTVKKTEIADFANINSRGIIAIKIHEGDELLWVHATSGVDRILLVSARGQSIQFEEADVRSMGRASSGVRGMKLKGEDIVVEVAVVPEGGKFVLLVTEGGMGKMSPIAEYRIQNRGGSGIKAMNVTAKTGPVLAARIIAHVQTDILIVSKFGQMLRTSLESITPKGRVTQGVCVMKFKEKDDKVASISLVEQGEEEADVSENQQTLELDEDTISS